MGKIEQQSDRDAMIVAMAEAITSTIYALEGDPDEDASPFSIGTTAAYAVLSSLESAGFVVQKRSDR